MTLRSILRRLQRVERRWIPPKDERDQHEATVRSRLDLRPNEPPQTNQDTSVAETPPAEDSGTG